MGREGLDVTNQVTVFSNGVADFHRVYDVAADVPTEISIPVRKSHIGDVLASLTIAGAGIRIAKPASYRPSNDMKGTLELEPEDVFVALAVSLSGAQVAVIHTGVDRIIGTLVGLDTVRERTPNGDIDVRYLVVTTPDTGLRRFDIAHLEGLQFQDPDVQAEIEKALKRNFERIKPDSTFVDITLAADEPGRAVIGYTIPAAAWKMSYRLHMDGAGDTRSEVPGLPGPSGVERSETISFQGNAIVDNNTEEHWTDVEIAVVTGEPLTFSTDLAEAKVPRRSHVDVVRQTAAGAVEVQEGIEEMSLMAAPIAAAAPASAGSVPGRLARVRRSDGIEAELAMDAAGPRASFEAAEVTDAGDFSVFRSPSPVTIDANRSAVIPMFALPLAEAKVVLHYKHGNNAQRPHRAVRFTNESDFSLTRGPCTIYEHGVFQGECIVPAIKPGGRTLLPHAVETGVRVRAEFKDPQSKLTRVKVADGWYIGGTQHRRVVVYAVRNNVERVYPMVLDHVTVLRGDVEAHLTVDGGQPDPVEVDERLSDGVRLSFELPAKATAQLVVTETKLTEQRLQITDLDHWRYIEEAIALDAEPLHAALQEAVALKEAVDDTVAQRAELRRESDVLQQKQARLRDNIGAVGTHATANQWRAELAASETRITEIESRLLPEIERTIVRQRKAVTQALRSAAAEWAA